MSLDHLDLVTVGAAVRVRAQAFPDSYQIEIEHGGKPLSKTTQIALAGNSVPPVMAEAIVRANVLREPGRAAA